MVTVGGEPSELIDRVRASDGGVSKQLKEIGDVLRDICKCLGFVHSCVASA